jgi:hypothetical protein
MPESSRGLWVSFTCRYYVLTFAQLVQVQDRSHPWGYPRRLSRRVALLAAVDSILQDLH